MSQAKDLDGPRGAPQAGSEGIEAAKTGPSNTVLGKFININLLTKKLTINQQRAFATCIERATGKDTASYLEKKNGTKHKKKCPNVAGKKILANDAQLCK